MLGRAITTTLAGTLLLLTGCAPASSAPGAEGEAAPSSKSPPTPSGPGSPPSPPPDASVPPAPPAPPAVTCRRSVCLTGAIDHASSSNAGFRTICESAVIAGRIDDCRSAPCKSTWGTFPSASAAPVWEAVFAALDTNKDGLVDSADAACELDVVGFSWGGVNAVDLAKRMNVDNRVLPVRRAVHRLVAIDAYQPSASLVVPPNVLRAVSFRHSVASPSDCSSGAPLGPYLGIAPRCSAPSACRDFDFSLSPDASFGGLLGKNVGHCDVPTAAASLVAQFLADQALSGTPSEVPVKAP